MRFREWYSFNKPFMGDTSNLNISIIRERERPIGSYERDKYVGVTDSSNILISDALDLFGDLEMNKFEISGNSTRLHVVLIKKNPNKDKD